MSKEVSQIEPVWKAPVGLYQPEENACVSCVIEQVLYMAGETDQPDVAATDKAIHRQPKRMTTSLDAYFYLMDKGLQLHAINPFEDRRFITEGLPYLQEFYDEDWDAMADLYTQEELSRRQRARETVVKRLTSYGKQFVHEVRTPEFTDINYMLSQKMLVDVTIVDPINRTPHTTLVHDIYDPGKNKPKQYAWYCPSKTDDGLTVVTEKELQSIFNPHIGIVGITR